MSTASLAAEPQGVSFSHNDWELACDNTRTCRAAGYNADGDDMAVSVLLTRQAGPSQAVIATLKIGEYGDNEALQKLPSKFKVSMRVNQQVLGTLNIDKSNLETRLNQQQTDALITALHQDSEIVWSTGKTSWKLSDKGAAAVLLKMDEFQKRIGTTGALYKKGTLTEDKVAPAIATPIVLAAPVLANKPDDTKLLKIKALQAALLASIKEDDCSDITEKRFKEDSLSINRLSSHSVLISTTCWMAAYNQGVAYWVVDDKAPYSAELLTTDASDYADGKISFAQKGRGLGDCWSSGTWTWDGKKFVPTSASTSGMCKLVAPGGAWDLPTLVTEVRKAGH
ncbi:DUF1176 domain-containing protein [Undibacterium jejuense]|uniref:DUF1176 domain-containing protein n=1 Tax=Undibacterium jejuense TaxID=1344949 RepID=A0A923HEK9_9BURK|nr:DUF1176 domain-containing protein [Undibacterium jejuense]MBC3862606.1 DUF1176 domain-containing protein [Undibacterium jejuense]